MAKKYWKVVGRLKSGTVFNSEQPIKAVFSAPHWWIPIGFQGIALENRVYLKREWEDSIPRRLVTHELVHTIQWRMLGALKFLFLYAWQWLALKLASKPMPIEEDARSLERSPLWDIVISDDK